MFFFCFVFLFQGSNLAETELNILIYYQVGEVAAVLAPVFAVHRYVFLADEVRVSAEVGGDCFRGPFEAAAPNPFAFRGRFADPLHLVESPLLAAAGVRDPLHLLAELS